MSGLLAIWFCWSLNQTQKQSHVMGNMGFFNVFVWIHLIIWIELFHLQIILYISVILISNKLNFLTNG